MPFTFAHPAASIPLLRPLGRYGVLSALVIGGIGPDLTYFLPFIVARDASHSPSGFFLISLPAGVICYLLLHHFYKEPLFALFPILRNLDQHQGDDLPRLTRWTAVFISLVCGNLTHYAWDSITHSDTLAFNAFPFLGTRLFTIGVYPVYLFSLLQYASGMLGLVFVLIWFIRWIRQSARSGQTHKSDLPMNWRIFIITALILVPVLSGILVGAVVSVNETGLRIIRLFTTTAIFVAFPAFAMLFSLYSAWWHFKEGRSNSSKDHPIG